MLPVTIGAAIYLLLRDERLEVFRWIRVIGLEQEVALARQSFEDPTRLPSWIRFNLPDALWCWAATAWLYWIWKKVNRWVLIPLIGAVVAESGQYLGLVRGTFDCIDVLAYGIGAAIPIVHLRGRLRPQYESQEA